MSNGYQNRIWAKSATNSDGSNITLLQHANDVLKAFNKLFDYLKSKNSTVLKGPLPEIIRLSILLHDFGKVHPTFQRKKLENRKYQPFDIMDEIPHSLFSLLWINIQKLKKKISEIAGNNEKTSESLFRFVLSTVAFHHWRENFNDFLAPDNYILSQLNTKPQEWWKTQEDNLINEIENLNSNSISATEFISKNTTWIEGLCNGIGLSHYVTPPYQLYYLPLRADLPSEEQRQWILISGFTVLADHFASYCEEEKIKIDEVEVEIDSPSVEEIKRKIVNEIKLKRPGFQENELWQTEAASNCSDKNTILVAPTGFGKTEFAWLWSNGKKFFYTLPLRSAVNQNYERTEKIFGKEKAGILHSDADVYLLGDGGEIDNLKVYDLARQLAQPAIISTGDQFFPYALRPPGYEKIFAKFSYSRLVIDEVQAYDPKAAAIVVKFLDHIRFMGGKFLLMTATLPVFIREKIEERIGNLEPPLNIYEDEKEKFSSTTKHVIQLRVIQNKFSDNKPDFTIPADSLNEIIAKAKEGKRVLVILNTVAQAQSVYRDLLDIDKDFLKEQKNIWLLHSRFTLAERKTIENEVIKREFGNPKPANENIGKILVSTQVVEASLDIDADIMFTEIAALDSLIQRMGRVLRRERSDSGYKQSGKDANIIVWTFINGIESGKGYVYHNELLLMSLKILSKTADTDLSEKMNYKNWIEKKIETKETKSIKISTEEVLVKEKKSKGKNEEKDSSAIYICQNSFGLSEYEKYNLVEKFYDLPANSDYLKKFNQTLDILDAGYMSDRKNEAQKIFREIYDISVIPEGEDQKTKKEFVEAIADFFNKGYEDKGLYTRFKNEVLSNYIVHVQLYKVRDHLVQWNEAFEQIKIELMDDKGVEEKNVKKLEWWLKGIYILPLMYDQFGLNIEKPLKNKGVIF